MAYGFIAAGVAISLQDVFKNFAGSIIIFTSRLYHVGNRIEIDGRYGDVIDIGLLYTTMLEIKEWVAGDQATGRIIMVPNSVVLSKNINNYTKDHHFLWDEVSIRVTYKSDWQKAMKIMTEIAAKETATFSELARKSISRLEQRYYVSDRTMSPSVYLNPADNWIILTLRYVVEVRERREVNSNLLYKIVEQFQKEKNIEIATTTLAIVDFPEIKVKKKK